MPKKKSETEEKDISEQDKILEEVAAKLKSIRDKDILSEEDKTDQDEKHEEEEQEEDQELNLGDLEFSQFMPSSESSEERAPVLERIAGSQPGPIFVGGMSQTPVNIPGEEEKTDEFKYVPGREGNNEPKYIASDSRISAEITPVDLMKVGRGQTEPIPKNQEAFFMHSELGSQIKSPTFEREWKAERIDIERAGRRNGFEEHDVKYKNYKPKLPK